VLAIIVSSLGWAPARACCSASRLRDAIDVAGRTRELIDVSASYDGKLYSN
jgi:hypothetical protein